MNEQREAIADRAVESEQQSKREYQLGNAQGIRCRHRQRHAVKAERDARGRVRENQLLDAPLQQKNCEKEPQDEKRGWNASVDFRPHLMPPWSSSPFDERPAFGFGRFALQQM